MSAEKGKWVRVRLPAEVSSRLDAVKKGEESPRRTKERILIDAIDAGLGDGLGKTPFVADIERDNFTELSEFLCDAKSLFFAGNDLGFVVEKYRDFLKEKVNLGNAGFILTRDEIERDEKVRAFVKEVADVEVEKYGGKPQFFVVDELPLNILVDLDGSKIVSWTKYNVVRGPFLYSQNSFQDAGQRLMQYWHEVILCADKKPLDISSMAVSEV